MMADGDADFANQLREEYVHKLGNLTLTGFNSTLGKMSFEKKRDRQDKQGKVVGYKNGLAINKELADADSWSASQITDRTRKMVDQIVELFDYERTTR